jgi:hypothetical protein
MGDRKPGGFRITITLLKATVRGISTGHCAADSAASRNRQNLAMAERELSTVEVHGTHGCVSYNDKMD